MPKANTYSEEFTSFENCISVDHLFIDPENFLQYFDQTVETLAELRIAEHVDPQHFQDIIAEFLI